MTFIYEVMTWGREGTTVDGTLTSLVGRGIRWECGPEFGLQLIMDAWFQGFGASAIDPGTAREFEECFELFLGKRIWIDAAGTVLDPETREPAEPKVNAYKAFKGQLDGGAGDWEGRTYLMLKPRSDEFRRRTTAIIESFSIEPGSDGEHAGLSVTVTDPKYLAHMGEHRWFRTAFTGRMP